MAKTRRLTKASRVSEDWAAEIGVDAYATIAELVENLRLAERIEAGEAPEECECAGVCECPPVQTAEDAREAIQEDPLSVQVRGAWYSPGEAPGPPEEFEILLSTGGPAVRIIGDLDEHGEPFRARLQVQDWFKPWTEYFTGVDKAVLLAYARCFYFGEGGC